MKNLAAARCFHCAEPLAGSTLQAHIGERLEPVCCAGCMAVAELIAGSGLEDFYRYRTAPSRRPAADRLAEDAWAAYARPEVAAQFVTHIDGKNGGRDSVALIIEGLRCSACSWLIERTVGALPGVLAVSVNAAVGRAQVEWRTGTISIDAIMRSIAQLGYTPHPLTEETTERVHRQERRAALKRLAVAGFGMMQVMMFAVADYAADIGGETIDAGLESYFRIVSLLVSVAVLFHAGKPLLVNAWNSVRARTVGMDLPVSCALLLAFVASAWNTLAGRGEVYFDSITMFVFFLTLARFVELAVRHRTNTVADALARHLPATAHRLRGEALEEVAAAQLQRGDVILVRSGEALPADGIIVSGVTTVDESLLTGEAMPVQRGDGDAVTCGTINAGAPIRVAVTAIGSNTTLSGIVALLRRAQTQKTAAARAADRAAGVFLRGVLIASAFVFAAWLAIDPVKAFPATLAVLVVACPCAFSIAMPAALAAATAQLARCGVLVTRPDVLESLAKVQHVIFDKTGTLTRGEIRVDRCTVLGSRSADECLAIAAALEQGSVHPIAAALRNLSGANLSATELKAVPGCGVAGTVAGERYRIGLAGFVAKLPGGPIAHRLAMQDATAGAPIVMLSDSRQMLAAFAISDELREDSIEAVRKLRQLSIDTEILSGDGRAAVEAVAQRCGVPQFFARRTPAQKLARVHDLQAHRKIVAMLGDGINDAPVLGAADVSIAMGRGAALALAAADLILVGERPSMLVPIIAVARKTMRIAHQNLLWSAVYNFCALPLAAFGLIPPWAAALGMSASSMLVLLNALRLTRHRESATNTAAARPSPPRGDPDTGLTRPALVS